MLLGWFKVLVPISLINGLISRIFPKFEHVSHLSTLDGWGGTIIPGFDAAFAAAQGVSLVSLSSEKTVACSRARLSVTKSTETLSLSCYRV